MVLDAEENTGVEGCLVLVLKELRYQESESHVSKGVAMLYYWEWFSTLAAHGNHLGSPKKYRHLGPTVTILI